ncbi:hypothetical protein ABVF54_06480 [Enterococcus mundtii]|uniref:MFS family major facilitator transporter n=1 Tax=Enterococcus mundtii TaxID=53346 RepID=A0AAI8WER9_ENTMU|nr:hypothetical protein [Enterococcus mundtii]MCA6773881.1 hypothetical protein [Enterococcus mundtii]BBM15862.1 MFS family major facilitator transporter [Enterococcus mundtii]
MSKIIYDEKNWKTNIAYLLTSQAISMIGTMLVQYAIIWHVTLSTQSGTMVGLMNAIGILPMVLVMLLQEHLLIITTEKKSLFYLIAALHLLLCSWRFY